MKIFSMNQNISTLGKDSFTTSEDIHTYTNVVATVHPNSDDQVGVQNMFPSISRCIQECCLGIRCSGLNLGFAFSLAIILGELISVPKLSYLETLGNNSIFYQR